MLNKSQNCEAGWFWFPRWTVVCKKKIWVLKWNQAKHAYSLLCRSSHTSMCNNDIVSWMIMLHWVISSLPNTELLSFTLILMLGDKRCYDYTYFSRVFMHDRDCKCWKFRLWNRGSPKLAKVWTLNSVLHSDLPYPCEWRNPSWIRSVGLHKCQVIGWACWTTETVTVRQLCSFNLELCDRNELLYWTKKKKLNQVAICYCLCHFSWFRPS